MTIFSKIIAGEIPCYKLAENERFICFLDIFPVKLGHALVVPKVETDKLFDLPEDFLSELLPFAKPIAKAIERACPCDRVSILTVGLEVPHAHLHLIPMDKTADMSLEQPKLKLSDAAFFDLQQKIVSELQQSNG